MEEQQQSSAEEDYRQQLGEFLGGVLASNAEAKRSRAAIFAAAFGGSLAEATHEDSEGPLGGREEGG